MMVIKMTWIQMEKMTGMEMKVLQEIKVTEEKEAATMTWTSQTWETPIQEREVMVAQINTPDEIQECWDQ